MSNPLPPHTTNLSLNMLEVEKSIIEESLYDFVQRFWDLVCPEPPIWNFHIRALCDILQEASERVFLHLPKKYDILINQPPGSTKSLIASIMLPMWTWTRFPQCRIICASYSEDLAMELSRKSRMIPKSEKWALLYPNITLSPDQDVKSFFANIYNGSRYCVGTNGTVTGMHGDIIIIDDPINPEGAFSEADLKRANRWISQTLSRRKTSQVVSLTIQVGQRLHQQDPSAMMLENAKAKDGAPVKHVCLPAEVDGDGLDDVRPRRLAKYYTPDIINPNTKLLDPIRLPRSVLEESRITLTQYGYAGQMLQRPSPPGGGMFKVDRITIDVPPASLKNIVRFWDKAGTKDGGAWTAGVKMGKDIEGQFWVLDVVRGQWDSAQREKVIQQTAQLDGGLVVVGVEQEPGSGGKESAEGTLRRLAGFRVRIERPTGDKVTRADPFSVQVNGSNVHMVRGDWCKTYINELMNFPQTKWKDQVDASSGAFTLLTKSMIHVGGGTGQRRK